MAGPRNYVNLNANGGSFVSFDSPPTSTQLDEVVHIAKDIGGVRTVYEIFPDIGDLILGDANDLGVLNPREGYTLGGWNSSSDGSGTFYDIGDVLPWDKQTYYAIWEELPSHDVTISYKGSTILTLDDSASKKLNTAGKYMEDDVEVVYTRPEGTDISDTTAVAADVLAPKIFHLSTGASAVGAIPTKTEADATVNQNVVTFPWGYYPSQVQKTVGIAQAAQTITPGNVNQVISSGRYLTGNQTILGDANLLSENIKSGVSIFGKMGTYEGGASTIIDPLSVVANGTYIAPSGHAYSPVSVNIDTQFGWETAPESWATGLVDRTISGSVYGSMVLTIGAQAFAHCYALSAVSFPACTMIGSYAFAYCSSISTVSFPACTTIGSSAFTSCFSLSAVSFPACTTIWAYAFRACYALSTVSFPACTTIKEFAFTNCTTLASASFPACTSIWSQVFASCYALSAVSFPVCTAIGAQAFAYCYALSAVSFPACTTIWPYAFRSCSALSAVSFPVCTAIKDYAFQSCSALSAVSFPVCTTIWTYAFNYCTTLASVSFPACKTVGSGAFCSCYALSAISFPACITIWPYAFNYCFALSAVSFPVCIMIGSSVFQYCSALASASFPACTMIGTYAFNYCSALSEIYFLASSYAVLSHINAFQYTPMQNSTYLGVFGSIYVPSSLVASYKAATNWAYYSSRIVGV